MKCHICGYELTPREKRAGYSLEVIGDGNNHKHVIEPPVRRSSQTHRMKVVVK